MLAFLTYFVVPASFIRKLNHRAMKKMKAREMHDPFDDDHDDGIDDDDTLGLANESDEDTSNDDGEVDTTSAPRQIKRQTTKKKTHRRNRTGSAILTSLLTTNESSDSYSDDDAFADDDEREEGRKKRGSQRRIRHALPRNRLANTLVERTESQRYKKYAKKQIIEVQKLFSMEDSLSKSIPVNSRWSLRLLFIANVLLFLSANTDSGASVSLFATLTTPVIDSSSFSSDLSSTPSFNGALLNAINGGRKTLLYANASSSTTTDNKNNKQQQQQQQKQQQKYNVIQASRKDLFNFSLGRYGQGHVARQSVRHCGLYRLFSGAWPYA